VHAIIEGRAEKRRHRDLVQSLKTPDKAAERLRAAGYLLATLAAMLVILSGLIIG
jgi:hypothetical protein